MIAVNSLRILPQGRTNDPSGKARANFYYFAWPKIADHTIENLRVDRLILSISEEETVWGFRVVAERESLIFFSVLRCEPVQQVELRAFTQIDTHQLRTAGPHRVPKGTCIGDWFVEMYWGHMITSALPDWP